MHVLAWSASSQMLWVRYLRLVRPPLVEQLARRGVALGAPQQSRERGLCAAPASDGTGWESTSTSTRPSSRTSS
jgi:hypothetical protein